MAKCCRYTESARRAQRPAANLRAARERVCSGRAGSGGGRGPGAALFGLCLAGEFCGAGLADYRDADLAGVGEFLLDLLGYVAGYDLGLDVVDLLWLDHDADL